jgi:hypothetical protein
MKIIELIIDENEQLSGVDAVSIVEFPAIESNFVSLNKQLALAKVDDEKRILMGAALIPNKHIYRRNGKMNITFSFQMKQYVKQVNCF